MCEALVMPTYFGPTNIPPVEAWSLGVPVLYSSTHFSHGKDAAEYFNPDSPRSLVYAILNLNATKAQLIRKGKVRIISIN